MPGQIDTGRRWREILAAIVRLYVAEGTPVGSKAIAERLAEPLSTATIRNCMAELEELGYLSQPHVSAGRVPTDKAYRYYVDTLLGSARLAPATEKYIEEALGRGAVGPEELMARSSRLLAEISHQVGLVLGPAPEEKVLEHIKFVRLPDRGILAVIVSKPDLIENKIVRLDDDVSQVELDEAAAYLNAEFHGWSLRAIRAEVFKRMEEMRVLSDRLLSHVANLFMAGALPREETGLLFVDGAARILDQPQFEDVRKMQNLLTALEQKAKLVKILNACLQSSAPGVRIMIGEENPASEMRHCTFIVAPFHYRHRAVGALGVIGPKRMEYDRAITAVDFVAHLCSKLLSSN